VRLTARLSATLFAAALILFAAGYPHDRQRQYYATRLFDGFIAAHTIHFATVAWLAVVTAGENIRQRDGWAAVTIVAVLFYASALLVRHAWNEVRRERSPSRTLRVIANVALTAIAAVFLNSYLSRVALMPVYWLPALGLVAIVALHFVKTRAAVSS
jgi:cation transport ATPase